MSSQAQNPAASGWRAWLLSASPASRRQARLGRLYIAWLAFQSNPLAMLGLGIVLALILVAVFAPLIAPYNPNAQVLADRLQYFSAAHPFGTDELGRSEEQTSELQSLMSISYAVFCLKKQNNKQID